MLEPNPPTIVQSESVLLGTRIHRINFLVESARACMDEALDRYLQVGSKLSSLKQEVKAEGKRWKEWFLSQPFTFGYVQATRYMKFRRLFDEMPLEERTRPNINRLWSTLGGHLRKSKSFARETFPEPVLSVPETPPESLAPPRPRGKRSKSKSSPGATSSSAELVLLLESLHRLVESVWLGKACHERDYSEWRDARAAIKAQLALLKGK